MNTLPVSRSVREQTSLHRLRLGQCLGESRRSGFTLVELLAVLALALVWALLLVPGLAKTQVQSRTLRCLNNTRQLAAAWKMYSADNGDLLVMVLHGSPTLGGAGASTAGNAPWALGWLDWTTSTDNTNTQLVASDRYSKLAKYFGRDARLLKCPADTYLSSAQAAARFKQRVRSYSASVGIGGGNAEEGPWDMSMYKHCKKISDLFYPGPAQTWVYVEEHPDSINDPALFSPNASTWVDLPAVYHQGSSVFAFGDGHSELHKWRGSLTRLQIKYASGGFPSIPVQPADPDLRWFSYHTARLSSRSY